MTSPPTERRERARPLSPEERRDAVVAATRPLLLEHGRATTTRMVAEAAGIAEGTVFRVFATKEALFEEVLERELDMTGFLDEIGALDLDLPLRERLVAMTTLMQARFSRIFAMMAAMGLPRPPASSQPHDRRRLLGHGMELALEPDRQVFRVPLAEVVRVLRLLTFAGTHPHLSADHTMTPDEIVDLVLHGVLEGSCRCC